MKLNKIFKTRKKLAIGGYVYENPSTAVTSDTAKSQENYEKGRQLSSTVSQGLTATGNPYATAIGLGMQATSLGKQQSSDEFGNYEGMYEGGENGGRGTFQGRLGSMLTGPSSANLSRSENFGEFAKTGLLQATGIGNAVRDIGGAEGYNKVFGKSSSEKNREETIAKRERLATEARLRRENMVGQYNQQDAINRGFSTTGNYDTPFYGKGGGRLSKLIVQSKDDPRYKAYSDSLSLSNTSFKNKEALDKSKNSQEYEQFLNKNEKELKDSSGAYKRLTKLNKTSPKSLDVFSKKLPTTGIKSGNEPTRNIEVYKKPNVEVVVKKEDDIKKIPLKGLTTNSYELPEVTMKLLEQKVQEKPKLNRKVTYTSTPSENPKYAKSKEYNKIVRNVEYDLEDEEYENGGSIKLEGGKLEPVDSSSFLAKGRSHDQGGIKLGKSAEIETGETVKDKGDSFMIMSDKLLNPLSGNTFAKDDLNIARQIKTMEKRSGSQEAMKLLEDKRTKLENLQQLLNGDNDSNKDDITEKRDLGGLINGLSPNQYNSMTLGDSTNNSKRKEIDLNFENGGNLSNSNKKVGKGDSALNLLLSSSNSDNNFVYSSMQDERIPMSFDSKRNGGKIKKYAKGGSEQFFSGTFGDEPIVEEQYDYQPIQTNRFDSALAGSRLSNTSSNEEELGSTSNSSANNGSRLSNITSRVGNILGSNTAKNAYRQASYNILPAADYMNATNRINDLKNANIPQPILQEGVRLNRMNMDSDRATVDRSVANLLKSYDRNLSDSNTSGALKAASLAQSIEAKQRINQNERNTNNEIANQQSLTNLNINQGNNALLNQKNQAELQKQIDLINSKGARNSKLYENLRDSQNTTRQEKHVQTQNAIDLARLEPSSRNWFTKYLDDKDGYNYGRTFSRKKGGKISKMLC